MRLHALRIALGYAVLATLWILFSDRALEVLIGDPELLIRLSVYKGMAFVCVTSLLLFLLTRRSFATIESGYVALQSHQVEIERMNRLYAALTRVNQAIVRNLNQHELFQKVCQELMESSGMCLVWIGWLDSETSMLVPVADGGDPEGYLQGLQIHIGSSTADLEPTRIAFIENRDIIVNQMRDCPSADPKRREIERRGIHACAAFPIRREEQVVGTLSVYANVSGFFQDKEIALLREVVGDMSFALGNLVEKEKRKEAEAALLGMNAGLEGNVAERTRELQKALVLAEAADRIKSAFLATMSHELRTPLNSIIGFTGIILQELPGPLNDEQRKQLGMVKNSARHLLDLINDVLDISKIEAGQLEVRAEAFILRDVVEQVNALVKPQADAKGLTLSADVSPALPLEMVSDRRRVQQILLNLVNNAIKFTDQGGVTVTLDPDPDSAASLRIRVADTGIGIRSEDLETLFQPFRQIETGLSRQHEGTGLGLAICRRLSKLLGGEISATSDKGSEFRVTLPLQLGDSP